MDMQRETKIRIFRTLNVSHRLCLHLYVIGKHQCVYQEEEEWNKKKKKHFSKLTWHKYINWLETIQNRDRKIAEKVWQLLKHLSDKYMK